MPDEQKYPYIVTTGNLLAAVRKFRNSLPSNISVPVLKRLQIAPSNERQVIEVLKFTGLIDDDGKPTPRANDLFHTVADGAFQEKLSEVITASYADLYQLHGSGLWALSEQELIGYFRAANQTSQSTGKRQALAFSTLSALAGKRKDPTSSNAAGPSGQQREKAVVKSRKQEKAKVFTKNEDERGEESPAIQRSDASNGKVRLDRTLNINIQIHIAADTPPDTIATIIEKMGQYWPG